MDNYGCRWIKDSPKTGFRFYVYNKDGERIHVAFAPESLWNYQRNGPFYFYNPKTFRRISPQYSHNSFFYLQSKIGGHEFNSLGFHTLKEFVSMSKKDYEALNLMCVIENKEEYD